MNNGLRFNFLLLILKSVFAALVRVQEVLKDPELREKKIVVRQFPVGTAEYRTTFKELHKMGIRNIIIDVPRDHIYTVLKHAQQVDMLSDYHNYFFTSLDVHTVDLEDFQYGGTNISGFSLVNQNLEEFKEVIRDWQSGPSRFGGWKADNTEQLTRVRITSNQFQSYIKQVSIFYFLLFRQWFKILR
jgi:hypothetical protein